MIISALTEAVGERAALGRTEAAGWRIAHSPDVVPDEPIAEWANSGEVVLAWWQRDALDLPGLARACCPSALSQSHSSRRPASSNHHAATRPPSQREEAHPR